MLDPVPLPFRDRKGIHTVVNLAGPSQLSFLPATAMAEDVARLARASSSMADVPSDAIASGSEERLQRTKRKHAFVDDVDVASEEDDPSVEEDDAHAATDEEDEVRRIASAFATPWERFRGFTGPSRSGRTPGKRAEAFPGDAKAA